MSKSEREKIILRSLDGDEFEVEKSAAMVSETLKGMAEEGCLEGVIPLENVSSKTLVKLIDYFNKHAAESDKTLHGWEADFVHVDDIYTLFDLIMAANFLNIKPLMDITAQAIADHIKDMSPEEVRDLFGITNDFTPEEEQKIRNDNFWAFEK